MARQLSDLRKLQKTQLSRLSKDELIESILASSEPDSIALKLNDVIKELADLRQAITSPGSVINTKMAELQQQVNVQAEIISKQQRFLEGLDRKERECNLVILGVPDTGAELDGETEDVDKVNKIWDAAGATSEVVSVRRLGDGGAAGGARPRRSRPILVTVRSKQDRDAVLNKAKNLKQCNTEAYKTIFIKKDVHPSVRAEWRRLREAEQAEKERPENIGCNIVFNAKERQLYKDGVVIDKWNWQGF